MNCPKCNVKLVMSERQGIEIDYCPECRGIWLDRGELDKIIERSTQILPGQNINPYNNMREHDHKHHDYYKHKKRGWLGELFD